MKSPFVLSMLFLVCVSCAHHRDVRAGANGIHRVLVRGEEKWSAERSAISQANHFCEKEKGDTRAAFTQEKTEYHGNMDEDTRKTVKQASHAAMAVGGILGAASKDKTPGAVVGGAGTVGAIMTGGDDYTADMKFKCQ